MTWCIANSTLMDRAGCGSKTSPSTAPSDGGFYLAVVIDAWSRRVVGWSIADHMRAELVADAIDMATWRRRPPEGAIAHSDHGSNYCSWVFEQRLRRAGPLGSKGTVGDALDNVVAESSFASL